MTSIEYKNGYNIGMTTIRQPNNYIMGVLPIDVGKYKINNNNYGWWIKVSDNSYNLYEFNSYDFITGFIEAFKSTENKDFRDYIYGPPMNKTGNFYHVKGYDIEIPETFYLEHKNISPFYGGGVYELDSANDKF